MTKAFELFKESLEKISDDDFAKLLDEMENDPQGQGITIGEFIDFLNQEPLIDEIISFNSEKEVNSSIMNDFLNRESLIDGIITFSSRKEASSSIINDFFDTIKIKQSKSKTSYLSNTTEEIDIENKNFLNAA
jgi:hypothetical protein